MVWCFIGFLYNKKNITWPLGDTKFFFSCWKNISTPEEKFRISARPCDIHYVIGIITKMNQTAVTPKKKEQAPIVRKVDSVGHRIILYPVDSAIGFPNTYPLDRDLSDG